MIVCFSFGTIILPSSLVSMLAFIPKYLIPTNRLHMFCAFIDDKAFSAADKRAISVDWVNIESDGGGGVRIAVIRLVRYDCDEDQTNPSRGNSKKYVAMVCGMNLGWCTLVASAYSNPC